MAQKLMAHAFRVRRLAAERLVPAARAALPSSEDGHLHRRPALNSALGEPLR